MQINRKTLITQKLKDFRIAKVKQVLEVKFKQQKEDKKSFELVQNIKPNSPNNSIILKFGLMKPEIKLHIESFPSEVVVIPKFLLKMINKLLKERTEDKDKKLRFTIG